MTDLERARRMLREWGDEADTVIADELAAARREGAEAAVVKLKAEAVADAERRGAEEMRERAAQEALKHEAPTTARAILDLPLTPEEP